jgi:hypothetical protein
MVEIKSMWKMKVIVIDSGSGRSASLLKKLNEFGGIDLQVLPASMTRNENQFRISGIEYSDPLALKLLGRSMSFPEIGCANSHNLARSIIARSEIGGVILEDDARICDFNNFFRISCGFLLKKSGKPGLLNLSNLGPLLQKCNLGTSDNLYFSRRICPSPLAVGYVVTSQAAEEMLRNNVPISMVSDWPISKVQCFSPSHQFVHHGDGLTVSIIDPGEVSLRQKRSAIRSLSILTGFHFLFQTHDFGIAKLYGKRVWWPIFSNKFRFLKGQRIYV